MDKMLQGEKSYLISSLSDQVDKILHFEKNLLEENERSVFRRERVGGSQGRRTQKEACEQGPLAGAGGSSAKLFCKGTQGEGALGHPHLLRSQLGSLLEQYLASRY